MKKRIFPLLLVLGLALWLRTFDLAHFNYFTHDEETIVWRIMPLLRDKDIFLLGGVTPLHFHLGPWFYYLSAFILLLGKLNPLSWGIAASLLGVITCYAVYFFGQKLFSRRLGLIAATLYATSFLMAAFDRHWWPMSLNPLLSLLVIYSLSQLVKKKWHFAIYLSIALSLGFHTDPSTWGLLVLSLIVWIKYKLPVNKKPVIISLLIFFFSFLPLIAFDLNNQGENILSVNQYLTETRPQQGLSLDRFTWVLLYIPRSLSRLLYPGSPVLEHAYAYCPQMAFSRIENASIVFTILTTAFLALFLLKKAKSSQHWIIKTYFLILFIALNIYGNFFSSDLFDHYLTTLFPLFFIILSLGIYKIATLPGVEIFLLTPILIINAYFFKHISTNQGYLDKQSAVNWTIKQLKGKPFALDSQSECFRFNGIRYLFTLQNAEPDLSFVDPNFFWLYDSMPQIKYPESLVVFIDNPALRLNYEDHVTDSQQFGNLEVLIVDNTNQDFEIKF